VIDFLDARLEPRDRELKPFAHADPRANEPDATHRRRR
jgi:hypothetical protein